MDDFERANKLLIDHEFRPSQDTVKAWLSTRKYSIGLTTSNDKHSGVFRTDDYAFDLKMYKTAWGLEAIGGIPIIFGAFAFGVFPFILAIVGVVVGFLMDVRLAMYLNRNQSYFKYIDAKLLTIKNDKTLSKAIAVDQKDRLERYRDDRKHSNINTAVKAILYLISSLKTFFFIWFIIISPLIYVAVAFGYFFIAWVHIKFTGYKKAQGKFIGQLSKDYRMRSLEDGSNDGNYILRVEEKPKEHTFNDAAIINDSEKIQECKIDKNIILERRKTGEHTSDLILKYRGIILDSEIEKMRSFQSSAAAKDLITIECLNTQVEALPGINIDTINNEASWTKQN